MEVKKLTLREVIEIVKRYESTLLTVGKVENIKPIDLTYIFKKTYSLTNDDITDLDQYRVSWESYRKTMIYRSTRVELHRQQMFNKLVDVMDTIECICNYLLGSKSYYPKRICAKASQYRNDIYWEFVTPITFKGKNLKVVGGEILKWVGYDDENWWNNVANQESTKQRTDKLGNIWEINFTSTRVKLVKKAIGVKYDI